MRFSTVRIVQVAFPFVLSTMAAAQITVRASIGAGGVQGDWDSGLGAISASGRYVAFRSMASNLVPGDSNVRKDIFVRDRALRTTHRVSVGPGGAESNGYSDWPAISANGRFVAFGSIASNLVPGDTNNAVDVFVHDRATGITTRASVGSGGVQANSHSIDASLSADGRFVAFSSEASNLVAGDTNGNHDVFVHDRLTGATVRASTTNDANAAPSLAADGTRIAFVSGPFLVEAATCVYVRDFTTGAMTCASVDLAGTPVAAAAPEISGDGRLVVFQSTSPRLVQSDTNGKLDIFVRDLVTGTTEIVSVGPNMVQGDEDSASPSISYGGRFIAFSSNASSFLSSDANGFGPDVFLRDRAAGTITLVGANSFSVQSNYGSADPAISLDGKHVAFVSGATNLVHGDTNGWFDLFVRDLP